MNPNDTYAALVRAARNRVKFPPATIENVLHSAGRSAMQFMLDVHGEARPEPAPGVPCECGQGVWVTRSSRRRDDGSRRVVLHCGACGATEHVDLSKVAQHGTTPLVGETGVGGTLEGMTSTQGSRP
jgi:hypothetical protein